MYLFTPTLVNQPINILQLPAAENIAEISLDESGIVVEGQGLSGGVARGEDALSLLDNPSTRNQFIDQLVEVCVLYFLTNFCQRLHRRANRTK